MLVVLKVKQTWGCQVVKRSVIFFIRAHSQILASITHSRKKALKLPLSSRCFLQYCGRVGCGVNLKLQSIICPWQWRFIRVLPIFLSCMHLCFIFVLLLFQDILQCRCFTTYVNVVRVTDVGTLNCKTKCAISLRTQHYYFSNPFMQKGSRSFL